MLAALRHAAYLAGGVCCLLCAQCASSMVRGRVTDCRDSAPLDGADVQLSSGTPGAEWNAEQTAQDGAYAFDVGRAKDTLPVTLTVGKKGYRSTEKVLSSVPSGGLEVCLQPTVR